MFYILIVLLENLVQRVGVHRTRDRSSFGVEIDLLFSFKWPPFSSAKPWTTVNDVVDEHVMKDMFHLEFLEAQQH